MKRLIVWMAVAAVAVILPKKINAQDDMKENAAFRQLFPQGERLPEQFSRYFTGQAYLAPLTQNGALNVPVSNVTFEPGCRNNWHSHTGGQLLICLAGRGYYQERGEVARELLPGDIVEIPADVEHWHGAAPDSWFSHLAIECNPQTNKNTWLEPVDDASYAAATSPRSGVKLEPSAAETCARWGAAGSLEIARLDPAMAAAAGNFMFGEIPAAGELDMKSRIMVCMASAVAQNAATEYGKLLDAALSNGVSPEEAVEVLFHAIPYAGVARVNDLADVAAATLAAHGVKLPLGESAVDSAGRAERGLELQKSIFGEGVAQLAGSMPEGQRHIARFLSANCFGDYQTRPVLDARRRELLTFAILISLGGCESQVRSHIQGNINVGNGKDVLMAVITQLLPYNGYPRTLNAMACLNGL